MKFNIQEIRKKATKKSLWLKIYFIKLLWNIFFIILT